MSTNPAGLKPARHLQGRNRDTHLVTDRSSPENALLEIHLIASTCAHIGPRKCCLEKCIAECSRFVGKSVKDPRVSGWPAIKSCSCRCRCFDARHRSFRGFPSFADQSRLQIFAPEVAEVTSEGISLRVFAIDLAAWWKSFKFKFV